MSQTSGLRYWAAQALVGLISDPTDQEITYFTARVRDAHLQGIALLEDMAKEAKSRQQRTSAASAASNLAYQLSLATTGPVGQFLAALPALRDRITRVINEGADTVDDGELAMLLNELVRLDTEPV